MRPGDRTGLGHHSAWVCWFLLFLSMRMPYVRVHQGPGWLKEQGLIVVLAAAVLLVFPRLCRDDDLVQAPTIVPKGLPVTFVAPLVGVRDDAKWVWC